MGLLNIQLRTKRLHGRNDINNLMLENHQSQYHYQVFDNLLWNFISSLNNIKSLFTAGKYSENLRNVALDTGGVDKLSSKYRLVSIIYDLASFRLLNHVRLKPLHNINRKFLHIVEKCIDAINISDIRNRKKKL